jgi:hypothetical protein
MQLPKFSMGVGDRFAQQGKAQLKAFMQAQQQGVLIAPVWNKSYREHSTIHTLPPSVRAEADAAVKALGWHSPYFVDADHIGLKTVDGFTAACDFFTLDVADFTGKPAADADIEAFVKSFSRYEGTLTIPGITQSFAVSQDTLRTIGRKYLLAAKEAGAIYRHIESQKGKGNFVTEVSMDETDNPQSPLELFFILGAIAQEGIPAQTIAPKFTGRFNKGVDYVGDVAQFAREFEQDVLVIAFAIKEFGLPHNLKLSVHSGSDKFSLYKPIREIIARHDVGLHLKTAGTTWLEELVGLAMAGGAGLEVARKVYAGALGRFDELCAPYATVIDIKKQNLPSVEQVASWDGAHYADALRHDQSCARFNPDFRQLLHVGYKVAAEMGEEYLAVVRSNETIIAEQVTTNVYQRHIKPLFLAQ